MEQAVYQPFEYIEKGFNIVNCMPFIGIYGGILRIAAGKVQAVGGIIFMATGIGGQLLGDRRFWQKVCCLGTENALHGVLNILRGYGESLIGVIGLVAMGLGSTILLIPNLAQSKPFAPFIPYGSIIENIPTLSLARLPG